MMYTLNARRAIRLSHSLGEFSDESGIYRGNAVSSVHFRSTVGPSASEVITSQGLLVLFTYSTPMVATSNSPLRTHLVLQVLSRSKPISYILSIPAKSLPLAKVTLRSLTMTTYHSKNGQSEDPIYLYLFRCTSLMTLMFMFPCNCFAPRSYATLDPHSSRYALRLLFS